MAGGAKESALDGARARRAQEVHDSVSRAVEDISRQGCKPSFYAVAAASGISRSTLYRRPELRALVEDARAGHALDPRAAGLVSELKKEVERLTQEVAVLRGQLLSLELTQGAWLFCSHELHVEFDSDLPRAA